MATYSTEDKRITRLRCVIGDAKIIRTATAFREVKGCTKNTFKENNKPTKIDA